jgi:hypothetical protein
MAGSGTKLVAYISRELVIRSNLSTKILNGFEFKTKNTMIPREHRTFMRVTVF